jgi:hypothetical protein
MCRDYDKCTIGSKIAFFAHPMVFLGDVGQVEARSGPFGDSVSLSARLVHCLHRMYHGHRNHFGHS